MPEPYDVENGWVKLLTGIGASNGPNIVQKVTQNKKNGVRKARVRGAQPPSIAGGFGGPPGPPMISAIDCFFPFTGLSLN